MAAEPHLFDHVRDALEGFVDPQLGELHVKVHRRGLKAWLDDAYKEPSRPARRPEDTAHYFGEERAETNGSDTTGARTHRSPKEHYEAQWLRGHHYREAGDDWVFEIGFHSEYSKSADNDAVLARVGADVAADLGGDTEIGEFLGNPGWRRISEVWQAPDPDDPDAAMDIAARLADYIDAIEPRRAAG